MYYADIDKSDTLMGVLLCVIAGHGKVMDIQKLTKQPQPNVSSKLMMLKEYKLVKKKGHKFNPYTPNWSTIYAKTYVMMRQFLNTVSNKNYNISILKKHFPKPFIKKLFKVNTKMFLEQGYKPQSLEDMIYTFFLGVVTIDTDKELLKINKKLLKYKKSIDKHFFLTSRSEILIKLLS